MEQPSEATETHVRRWETGAPPARQAPFAGGPTVRVVIGATERAPVGVLEVTLPAGAAMPEHDHGDSAVLLVPLAGRLRLVEASANHRTSEVEPGAVATIPTGLRVRLENPGDREARCLVVLTPPDFAERLDTWPVIATLDRQ